MPRLVYESKKFTASSEEVIAKANAILADYAAQGFDLTLRQLYYQFVARGLLANKDQNYKRLGSIVNDARMAGRIDWSSIVDRTRNLRGLNTWATPASVIRSAAHGYREDLWRDQPWHVEVWIEKDALVGVIEGVCNDHRVDYFSCRGYTSQSEMWSAAQRLGQHLNNGRQVRILHLGDHDPSGIDMTRDIQDRLLLFMATDLARDMIDQADAWGDDAENLRLSRQAYEQVSRQFSVDRIALTMAQIEEYDPPPNPAKLTDSRGASYVEEYGYESWELDALEPTVLAGLIRDGVEDVLDDDQWQLDQATEDDHRNLLTTVSSRWAEVASYLTGDRDA